jgi:hypothetical protein
MRSLAVQFQLGRTSAARVASVVSLMARIAGSNVSLRGFAYRKGNDRGRYVNFQFEVPAEKLAQTLASIVAGAFRHRVLGPSLRRSCIVTCEGTRGWDNYLLLYHFKENLKLDTLRNV